MIYNFDFDKKYEKVDNLNREKFRNIFAPVIYKDSVFNLLYNTQYLKEYYFAKEELKKVISDLYFDSNFAKDKNPIEEYRKIVESVLKKHSTYETKNMFNNNLIMLYNDFDCEYREERISA